MGTGSGTNRLALAGLWAYTSRGGLVHGPAPGDGWRWVDRGPEAEVLGVRRLGESRRVAFGHDHLGERVAVYRFRRSGRLEAVRYTVRGDDGQVLSEVLRAEGIVTRLWDRVYAGGRERVGLKCGAGGAVTYATAGCDHLGSLHAAVGEADRGRVMLDRWPYGSLPRTQSAGAAPALSNGAHIFTGHEREYTGTQTAADPLEGLDFMHARYYSSNIGRFLSVDPVGGKPGLSQSWNRYAYVRGNPVNAVDPDGRWVGVDDAIFTLGGALVGVLGQGVGDLISIARGGHASGWEDYVGAAVGGAVGGEALLYTGPVGAGAVGGAVTNLAKQGLKNLSGKQSGFDGVSLVTDTAVGAATGLIPGAKVPGITTGRGSLNQVYKQMVTKAAKGTIKRVKVATAIKMFVGRSVDAAFVPGAGAAGAAAGSGLLPSSEKRRPPSDTGRRLPLTDDEEPRMVPSH